MLQDILSSRVKRHHRICGYCTNRLKTPSSLRRHIREMPDHKTYHHFLRLLHKYDEPISLSEATDRWIVLTFERLRKRENEKEDADGLLQDTPIPPRERCADTTSLLEPLKGVGHTLLLATLSCASLFPLGLCPTWVRQSWEGVGGLPVVFASSQIYYGAQRHVDRDLFVQYLSSAQVRLFVDGVEDSQQRSSSKQDMIYGLAYEYRDVVPSDNRISAAFSLKEDRCFYVPRLASDPLAQGQEDTEVILTPRGGLTDLHIGGHDSCPMDKAL